MALSSILFERTHSVEQLIDIKKQKSTDKILMKVVKTIRSRGKLTGWIKATTKFTELNLSKNVLKNSLDYLSEYYHLDMSNKTFSSIQDIVNFIKTNKVNLADSIFLFNGMDDTDEDPGFDNPKLSNPDTSEQKKNEPIIDDEPDTTDTLEVPEKVVQTSSDDNTINPVTPDAYLPEDAKISTEGVYSYWFGRKDVLSVGKLSDKSLDHSKLEKLRKYPEYLRVLKSWCNIPNYSLLPSLKKFGKIIDKLYGFNKQIIVYRGLRLGLTWKHKQETMGLINDTMGFYHKLKDNIFPGYTFTFSPSGPLSTSRSPWIAKVYGDLILKCKIPPSANKLIITNELAYLLQELDEQYFQYRKVNMSTMCEIILFPGQSFDFTIVTDIGDIHTEIPELYQSYVKKSSKAESDPKVDAAVSHAIARSHEAFGISTEELHTDNPSTNKPNNTSWGSIINSL